MTRIELLDVLIKKYIAKYGEQEVRLNNPIYSGCVDDYTDKTILKVRQKNGKFEFYVDAWAYGWYRDAELIGTNILRVLQDVLEVQVKKITTYEIIE